MSWTLVHWQWHSKSSNDNSSSITASGGMQNYNANKMTIQKPHAKRGWFLLHIVSKTNKYDQNRLQLTSKKLFFDSAWWELHLKHAWFRLNWCPIILRNIPEPCWISTRVTSENEIIKSLYNFLDLDTSESQVSSVLRFFSNLLSSLSVDFVWIELLRNFSLRHVEILHRWQVKCSWFLYVLLKI